MAKENTDLPEGLEFEPNPDDNPEPRGKGIPEINWASVAYDEEYDVQIDDGSPQEPTDTAARAELREELEKLKRQNEELLGRADSNKALQEAISGLGQSLRVPQGQQFPMAQQQPGESEDEFKKRFNTNIFEGDAYGLMEELQNRKLAPERHQQMVNNLYHSKRDIETDRKLGPVFQKYGSEIDEELQKVNPDVKRLVPDIYRKITESVASRHMDEILSESLQSQVEERVKEALRGYGIDPDKPKGPAPAPNYAETNRTRPSGGGSDRPRNAEGKIIARLTPSEKAYAQMKGVKDAALWETLQRNQSLKKFVNETWTGRI